MALTLTGADGQLPVAKATLYSCPATSDAMMVSIALVNTDVAARTCNIYLNRTGTSRRIIPKDKSLAAGDALLIDTKFTLGASDLVEGDASAATVVDYVISVVERA